MAWVGAVAARLDQTVLLEDAAGGAGSGPGDVRTVFAELTDELTGAPTAVLLFEGDQVFFDGGIGAMGARLGSVRAISQALVA